MRADTSRFTFDRTRHFRRVYDQQGRVTVDADGIEREDIGAYLRHTAVRDIVGPTGGPLDGAGFEILLVGTDLHLSAGRYWVGGRLVENDTPGALIDQPYLPPGASLVRLANGDEGAMPPSPGVYVAFLETWERLVTATEDDSIREPALGGPDTTVRTQAVWQARLLRAGPPGTPVDCLSDLAAWNSMVAPPGITLAARSAVGSAPPDDCEVPADAGFRGTENQHYRVEIHEGGGVGSATFKWSRENASVITRWVGRNGNDLTVSSPGRDGALGFAPGDWVELIDESRELRSLPGTLVRLSASQGDVLTVDPATATGTLAIADFPLNPRIRRWESDGAMTVEVPASNDGWIPLELGVEVRFPGVGGFRTGQWWSIPARTVLGDVMWPRPGGVPASLPPFNEPHGFARLAIVEFVGGAWNVLSDCRNLFPSLTGLETLDYLSGDGQQVLPDTANPAALVTLPERLRVGVSMGRYPVENASVEFTVTDGAGQVDGGPSAVVTTDVEGVASVVWAVDSAMASQTVTARLLDAAGDPVHLPVQFNASLLFASEVAYQPGECADLTGAFTVQDALDRLCEIRREGCATVVVSPGAGWADPILQLAAGSSAHVCFRPGDYPLAEPLVLEGMGSLVFTGSGAASRIVAPDLEMALLFRDCDEVVIRDLGVRTGVAATTPERPGLNGAVTTEGCGIVRLEGATLQCGAGTRRAASCLTVRRSAQRMTDVARIRDCRLVPGHLQVGVLLLDVDSSEVTGNRVVVSPKPKSLSFDVLVADPARRRMLARQLFSNAVASDQEVPAAGSFTTQILSGGYAVAFDSAVPQSEWQALALANPPTEAQRASQAGMQEWMGGLVNLAGETPSVLPSYQRSVSRLRSGIGEGQFNELMANAATRQILRTQLVAGSIRVVDPLATGSGSVTVSLGKARVRFDSVLTAPQWLAVLRAGGVRSVPDGVALRDAMSRLSLQAVTDAALRGQVPALGQWFAGLVARNPAVASRGVVVGGRSARSVSIEGNRFVGVAEAVHVGLSRRGPGAPDTANSVRIDGNHAVLRVPMELFQAPRAWFLGNVRHGVVTGNHAEVQGMSGRALREGVRVWGVLGPMVRVQENLLEQCEAGVRVQPVGAPPNQRRWIVSGNVAPGAAVGVAAPPSVTRSQNVP